MSVVGIIIARQLTEWGALIRSWNLKSLVSLDLFKWVIIIIIIVIIIIIIVIVIVIIVITIIILSLSKGRCWQILLVSLYDGGPEISWKSMQKICHKKKKVVMISVGHRRKKIQVKLVKSGPLIDNNNNNSNIIIIIIHC